MSNRRNRVCSVIVCPEIPREEMRPAELVELLQMEARVAESKKQYDITHPYASGKDSEYVRQVSLRKLQENK